MNLRFRVADFVLRTTRGASSLSTGGLRVAVVVAVFSATTLAQTTFVRDPKVAVDEEYTGKIREYTTQPFFTSPLVD